MKRRAFFLIGITIFLAAFFYGMPIPAHAATITVPDLSQCALDANSNVNYTMAADDDMLSCGPVDTTQYIIPTCGSGGCDEVQASAFSKKGSASGGAFNHIVNNVVGGDGQKYTELISSPTQNNKDPSTQRHLLYTVSGSTIIMTEDTTFANTQTCGPNGSPIYQRVQGTAPVAGTSMSCKQAPVSGTATNQVFLYSSDAEKSPMMANPPACNATVQAVGKATDSVRLIYAGQAKCNSENPKDIIATQNVGGAGAGEVYIYCKGQGLCAQYEGIDFTVESHKPKNWLKDNIDVCGGFPAEIKACGEQYDNQDHTVNVGQSKTCDIAGNCTVSFAWGEPFKPQADKLDTPVMFPFAGAWLGPSGALPYLTPGVIGDAKQDNTNDQVISTGSTRCVYDNNGVLKDMKNSSDTIQTAPIKNLPQLEQGLFFLSAIGGHGKNTSVDYREPQLTIDSSKNNGCAPVDIGAAVQKLANAAVGQNSFDLFQFAVSILQAILHQLVNSNELIIPYKKCPYCGSIAALTFDYTKSNVLGSTTDGSDTLGAEAPIDVKIDAKSKEEGDNIYNSGGFVQANMPGSILATRPSNNEKDGTITNNFNTGPNDTNHYLTRDVTTGLNWMCQSVFPGTLQPNCATLSPLTPTPTPTPTPTIAPNDLTSSGTTNGTGTRFNLPKGFTTYGKYTDAQLAALKVAIANLAACHGAGVSMDSSKCAALGEPANVAWTGSLLGDASTIDKILSTAQSGNLNPAFITALCVEETHCGAANGGNPATQHLFGCGPKGAYLGVDAGLTCLTDKTVYPATGKSYLTDTSISGQQALCTYAYGGTTPDCDQMAPVMFPGNISHYVNILDQSGTTTTTTPASSFPTGPTTPGP